MQQHTHSQPRKIVQTRDDMMIAYEANGGLRHILLDGRPLPANDPQPFWQGYSVGRWEGDTLVVQSMGFRDDGWLDVDGSYFGTTTRVTERFRRVTYGRLELDVTVEDAKAYTRPWTVRINYRLVPDQQLIEFVCNENEQSSKHYVDPKWRLACTWPTLHPQCARVSRSAGRRAAAARCTSSPRSRRGRGPCRRSSAAPNSPCTQVEDRRDARRRRPARGARLPAVGRARRCRRSSTFTAAGSCSAAST